MKYVLDGGRQTQSNMPLWCTLLLVVADPTSALSCTCDTPTNYEVLTDMFIGLAGDNWPAVARWNLNGSVCKMYGITCNNATGAVTGVALPSVGSCPDIRLAGSLPTAVVRWNETLTTFRLCGQSGVNGSIPFEFSFLSSLVEFSVHSNNLSGTIPSFIGSWKNLATLQLSSNEFIGSIPSVFGSLRALVMFSAAANRLNGSLPSTMGECRNLSFVGLMRNSFSGSIPDSFANLSLTVFHVGENRLSGTLPSFIGEWRNITLLAFFWNHFSGSIPASFANLTALTSFSVDGNALNGTLPSFLGGWPWIVRLGVSANSFTGTLPDSLGNLAALSALFADRNNFSGTIPSTYANLRSLTEFNVANNRLSGTLPSFIGHWWNATTIILSSNGFVGTLPPSWGMLNALQTLQMSGNSFAGTLPFYWGLSMQKLKICSVSGTSTRFCGSVPLEWLNRSVLMAAVEGTPMGPCAMYLYNYFSVKQVKNITVGFDVGNKRCRSANASLATPESAFDNEALTRVVPMTSGSYLLGGKFDGSSYRWVAGTFGSTDDGAGTAFYAGARYDNGVAVMYNAFASLQPNSSTLVLVSGSNATGVPRGQWYSSDEAGGIDGCVCQAVARVRSFDNWSVFAPSASDAANRRPIASLFDGSVGSGAPDVLVDGVGQSSGDSPTESFVTDLTNISQQICIDLGRVTTVSTIAVFSWSTDPRRSAQRYTVHGAATVSGSSTLFTCPRDLFAVGYSPIATVETQNSSAQWATVIGGEGDILGQYRYVALSIANSSLSALLGEIDVFAWRDTGTQSLPLTRTMLTSVTDAPPSQSSTAVGFSKSWSGVARMSHSQTTLITESAATVTLTTGLVSDQQSTSVTLTATASRDSHSHVTLSKSLSLAVLPRTWRGESVLLKVAAGAAVVGAALGVGLSGSALSGAAAVQLSVASALLNQRCLLPMSVDGVGGTLLENPMQVELTPLQPSLRLAGGAVLGNAAASMILTFVSTVLNVFCPTRDPTNFLLRLQRASVELLPGTLLPSLSLMLQPTASCALTLLISANRSAASVALGLAAVLCIVALLLWMTVAVWFGAWRGRSAVCVERSDVAVSALLRGARIQSWLSVLELCMRDAARQRWEWHSLSRDETFVRRYSPCFADSIPTAPMYFAFDLWTTVASSVVASLGLSLTADGQVEICSLATVANWLLFGIAMLRLVVLLWVRPMSAVLATATNALFESLTVVTTLLSCVAADESAAWVGLIQLCALFGVGCVQGLAAIVAWWRTQSASEDTNSMEENGLHPIQLQEDWNCVVGASSRQVVEEGLSTPLGGLGYLVSLICSQQKSKLII